VRPFSASTARFEEGKPRRNDTADKYQQIQKEKATNPHMTNTNSTIANEMSSVGKDNAPPELLTRADDGFVPKDSVPENTERMTGGTQQGAPETGVNSDLDVGEIEGGKFRVEPLRRTGEDLSTMRARLICSSIALYDYRYDMTGADFGTSRSKQEKGNTRERPLAFHFCGREFGEDVGESDATIRYFP